MANAYPVIAEDIALPLRLARIERLLYVGLSRARQHVALIVPGEVARRL